LSTLRIFAFVRLPTGEVAFQASIASPVRSSIRTGPNAGSRCARMIER
jgi:hypothetical protein